MEPANKTTVNSPFEEQLYEKALKNRKTKYFIQQSFSQNGFPGTQAQYICFYVLTHTYGNDAQWRQRLTHLHYQGDRVRWFVNKYFGNTIKYQA